MKKFLAILVAILMLVTTIPFAFAAEGETTTLYLKISDESLTGAMIPAVYVKDDESNVTKVEYNYYVGNDTYSYIVPAVSKFVYWELNGGGTDYYEYPFIEIPASADSYHYEENRWYCSHQMGEGLVENGAVSECEICGDIFREIYVNWLIGWHLGSYEMKFFDSVGNELFYEIEFIEDNFDLCRVSVDAVSYWFSHSNGASDEGTIPEKVDYYEASSKTWRCSHQLDTNGVKNCLGQVCEICGKNYGEADPNAHDWSNCDGICMNGCGTECVHADQTGSACEICGKSLHACDFSGEWVYDENNHYKECSCGELDGLGAHEFTDGECLCGYCCEHESYTEGVCDECGYECPHEYIDECGYDYCYDCGYIISTEIAIETPHTVTETHFVHFTPAVSGRYYFYSYDSTDGADPYTTVYEENCFNYIGYYSYNENLTYGAPGYNEFVFEADLVAGKTYYFELGEYLKTNKGEDFEYTAMIKKICDDDNHTYTENICGVCGYKCLHPVATDGICDYCGCACTHNRTIQNIVSRPVQNGDGTWTKGTLEINCQACGNVEHKEIERDHEGYRVFDETAARLEALLAKEELLDGTKNGYTGTLNSMKNSAYAYVFTEIESTLPSMTGGLNSIIAVIEAGIADGTMVKADLSYMTSLLDEVNAIIDSDPNKIVANKSGLYYGPYYYHQNQLNNNNLSQADYNRNMLEYDFENQLIALLAGLKDGSMLKADYTEIDEAVTTLEKVKLTDEAKAQLGEIKAELSEMRKNTLSSKADVEELMKAVEELEKGVEDGTIVLVDGVAILEAYDAECSSVIYEKYGKEAVDRIVSIMFENVHEELVELYAYADTITGTLAENADKIEELKRKMDALYDAIERCVIGTHTCEECEITSPAKCEVNAIESGVCYYCNETIEREVENTALTHSFTKYEVVDAPTCTVEGKAVALCDNGCNVTDEKAVEVIAHSFTEYTYNEDATCTADGTKTATCDYGCGETDTITAEGTMIDHTDEDCDKLCDVCQAEIPDEAPEDQVSTYINIVVTLINLILSLLQSFGLIA